MPVAGFQEIIDEMADQIRNALSTDELPIQVEPDILQLCSPPTIDIFPADVGRDPNTAGMGDLAGGYLLTVRARVQQNDAVANTRLLIAFLDDQNDLCLAHALMDEPTLNGNAASTSLEGVTGFLEYPTAGLIGVQWTFLVIPGAS